MLNIQKIFPAFICLGLLAAVSCNNSGNNNTSVKDSVLSPKAQPISISAVEQSPEFNDAQLSIASVAATKQGTDSAKISFNFSVKNYELKVQTKDTGEKHCSNSGQGQHIHFIMDNQPYKALYEPKNEIVLANNTEHYLLAFLSRSYHESLKNKGAAVVYHFKIDEKGNLKKLDDPKDPMIFYSRPKGDYVGKDTKNVLFDFYLWNATLSPDNYKVKADIHSEGKDTSMMLSEWKAYFLHNLSMGKSSIQLTLVDKDGNEVKSAESSVTRQFQLAESEPAK